MKIFKLKTGDTQPISISLTDAETGDAIDLTDATATFTMVLADNDRTVKVDEAEAEVYEATNGEVRYNFVASDVDTVGEYYGFFEITYSGGKKQTVPADDSLKIIIGDDYV